jgi:hypothetical protein
MVYVSKYFKAPPRRDFSAWRSAERERWHYRGIKSDGERLLHRFEQRKGKARQARINLRYG